MPVPERIWKAISEGQQLYVRKGKRFAVLGRPRGSRMPADAYVYLTVWKKATDTTLGMHLIRSVNYGLTQEGLLDSIKEARRLVSKSEKMKPQKYRQPLEIAKELKWTK